MNKRGDFPTIILVLIALVLSTITLYTFATFNSNFGKQSQHISGVIGEIEFNEQYIKETTKKTVRQIVMAQTTNLEESFKQYIEETTPVPGTENFFGKIKRHTPEKKEFTLTKKENNYIFQMQNISLTSQVEQNKIQRTLNPCFEFNSRGEFLNNC